MFVTKILEKKGVIQTFGVAMIAAPFVNTLTKLYIAHEPSQEHRQKIGSFTAGRWHTSIARHPCFHLTFVSGFIQGLVQGQRKHGEGNRKQSIQRSIGYSDDKGVTGFMTTFLDVTKPFAGTR